MATSSDLASFVCGSSKNQLSFCHANNDCIQLHETPNQGNLSLSIRNDNRLLALGGKDGMYVNRL